MATTKNNTEMEAQLVATKEAYQASCQILGNYYALHAQTKNEVKLALPYFRSVLKWKPCLKVSSSQNEILVSSNLTKSQPNFRKVSAL